MIFTICVGYVHFIWGFIWMLACSRNVLKVLPDMTASEKKRENDANRTKIHVFHFTSKRHITES